MACLMKKCELYLCTPSGPGSENSTSIGKNLVLCYTCMHMCVHVIMYVRTCDHVLRTCDYVCAYM